MKSSNKEIGSIALHETPPIGQILIYESKSYRVKEIIKEVPKYKLIVELVHNINK